MRFTDNAAITTDNMATDDILAGTDVSASADKKFSLANLANWFLNKFTGLSLAGSQQTVKSALDSLNSNLGIMSFQKIAATVNTTTVINIPNGYRGIMIITDSQATRSGVYMLYATGAGNVGIVSILNATAFTIDTTALNKITISAVNGTPNFIFANFTTNKIS